MQHEGEFEEICTFNRKTPRNKSTICEVQVREGQQQSGYQINWVSRFRIRNCGCGYTPREGADDSDEAWLSDFYSKTIYILKLFLQ